MHRLGDAAQVMAFAAAMLALLPLASAAYKNPIEITADGNVAYVADPGVIRWMGKYYLYATKVEEKGIRCWESSDLVNWKFRAYVTGDDPVFAQRMAWSPAPFYWNGKFYLYQCGPDLKHHVFEADKPWGPFKLANGNLLDVDSLDAQMFADDDGQLYLAHQGWGGIRIRKCSSPTVADGKDVQLTSCTINAQDTNQWTEGPDLFKIDGRYYLCYCGNDWKSNNYQVHAAHGKTIESIKPQPDNPLISQLAGPWVATGCSWMVTGPDLTSLWAVYHCRRNGAFDRRLAVDRVGVDAATGDLAFVGPTWNEQPDPRGPDWSEGFRGKNVPVGYTKLAGKWQVSDGALKATPDAKGLARMSLPKATGPDFTFELNFRLDKISKKAGGGFFGLSIGAGRNALLVGLNPGGGLAAVQGDGTGKIIASAKTKLLPEAWHTIVVTKQGERLRVLIDRMQKIDIKSPDAHGTLGLIARGCSASFGWMGFSNFRKPEAPTAKPGPRLLSQTPLADPYPVLVDGQWQIYGTDEFFLKGMLTNVNLKAEQMRLDFGEGKPQYQIWSFSPYKHSDGSWHAYGSIHYGSFRTAVGHFVRQPDEKWLDGRRRTVWKLENTLVGSEQGPHAYDGRMVADEDGTLYLVYCTNVPGSGNVRIEARRMLSPGVVDQSYEPRAILESEGLRSEDRNPGFIQIVEGASISRINGKYVLLYSVGDFSANNYKLAVAYSDTLIPESGKQYQKVYESDPGDVWKSGKGREVRYLLQSEREDWPNCVGKLLTGPGLGSIQFVGGKPLLVFHGYKPDDPEHRHGRYVWTVPLAVDIRPDKPMEQWILPVLK